MAETIKKATKRQPTKKQTSDSSDSFFDGIINDELLALYVRYYQSNQRQGTAKTKTRSEVSGGGVKPFEQKGTGRARTGSRRGPTHVHGGISHGPVPRKYTIALTPLMKKGALKSSLNQKNVNNAIVYLENTSVKKTADVVKLLKANDISNKALFIMPKNDLVAFKPFNNIKNAFVRVFDHVNAYDVLNADKVIFVGGSFDLLKERL